MGIRVVRRVLPLLLLASLLGARPAEFLSGNTLKQRLDADQAFIAKSWAYFDWCLNADIQMPVCRPFWMWVMFALLGVGALAVVWITIEAISYRLKLAAALRAEAYRASVADEDTMRAHRWEGDKAYQGDLPPEDIERRIKEALAARANEARPPPSSDRIPHASGLDLGRVRGSVPAPGSPACACTTCGPKVGAGWLAPSKGAARTACAAG